MIQLCTGMLQGHRGARALPKTMSERLALCIDFRTPLCARPAGRLFPALPAGRLFPARPAVSRSASAGRPAVARFAGRPTVSCSAGSFFQARSTQTPCIFLRESRAPELYEGHTQGTPRTHTQDTHTGHTPRAHPGHTQDTHRTHSMLPEGSK